MFETLGIFFQNFVFLATSAIAYMIPDMPRKLKEQLRREGYLTNEIILKTELEIARGADSVLSDIEMRGIRHRVLEAISAPVVNGNDHKPSNSDSGHPLHEYMIEDSPV